MVLPIPDLTGVIAAIDRNTSMMQNIVDEFVRFNEEKQTELETQVRDIREILEQQYRDRITDLEKRLDDVSPIPGINTPTRGGLGDPPGPASP